MKRTDLVLFHRSAFAVKGIVSFFLLSVQKYICVYLDLHFLISAI